MNKTQWLVAAAAALVACSPPNKVREICGNGFDDDDNGFADCADVDCAGQAACPPDAGGQFGSCAKCGETCTRQDGCLEYGYASDRPLPDCAGGRCQSFNQALQVAVEVDIGAGGWNFIAPAPRTMQMRFLRKTALDGSAVTCAVVQAVATGKATADADQVERSGKFNLVGFDVTPLPTGSLPTKVTQPYVNVGTAQDFLLWIEIWTDVRDSTTKLPTGIRKGWGCFETGPAVAPLVPENNCPPVSPPAPSCRVLQVEMPGPQ